MAAPLDPTCLFSALDEHGVDDVLVGGLAAVLHGSTAMTNDADIVPDPDASNLDRLAEALRHLSARLRVPETPDGVEFDPHPALLASMNLLNLTTRCGDLDLTFAPVGLDDYAAIASRAVSFSVGDLEILVASLDDIIRSKTVADRPKDHATLPILHALREEIERGH